MKEQLWLTSVKYLLLYSNTSWVLVFCIDTSVNTNSNIIGPNKEKEICWPTSNTQEVIDEKK